MCSSEWTWMASLETRKVFPGDTAWGLWGTMWFVMELENTHHPRARRFSAKSVPVHPQESTCRTAPRKTSPHEVPDETINAQNFANETRMGDDVQSHVMELVLLEAAKGRAEGSGTGLGSGLAKVAGLALDSCGCSSPNPKGCLLPASVFRCRFKTS